MSDQDYGWFGLLAAGAVGVGVGFLLGLAQQAPQAAGPQTPLSPAQPQPQTLGAVAIAPGLPQALQTPGQRSTQDLGALAASLPSGVEGEVRMAQLGLSPSEAETVRQFQLVNQRAMGAGGGYRVA